MDILVADITDHRSCPLFPGPVCCGENIEQGTVTGLHEEKALLL
jgi:hypothetical protein